MSLTTEQRERYARQLALPEIGLAGQKKLRLARVLLVGLGGLGSSAGYYLAAAGIGTIGLMDSDRVELSNLQRQILHCNGDVGRLKVESVARSLNELDPDLKLELFPTRLCSGTDVGILDNYDFVVDATDSYESKLAVSDACHAGGTPYVHAGLLDYSGHVMTVLPGQTACYRCVFGADESDNDDGNEPRGPLGALPGILGCVQAAEAIKYILSIGTLLVNRLLVVDVLKMSFRDVKVNRNPVCRLCGN